MRGDGGIHVGIEGAQGKEGQHQGKQQGPQRFGRAARAFLQGAFRLEFKPQCSVIGEHDHEKQASRESVRIEQGEEVPLIYSFRINGNAPEQIGKGHAEKQRGDKVAEEEAGVPHSAPQPAVDLVAEFKSDGAEDQGEKQYEQRSIKRAEHGCIGQREGGECHAAGCNQPYLIPIPERAGGIVDHAFFRIAPGQEGHERPHAEVKAVKNEVDGPQQNPQYKPDCFQHGYSPALSG